LLAVIAAAVPMAIASNPQWLNNGAAKQCGHGSPARLEFDGTSDRESAPFGTILAVAQY